MLPSSGIRCAAWASVAQGFSAEPLPVEALPPGEMKKVSAGAGKAMARDARARAATSVCFEPMGSLRNGMGAPAAGVGLYRRLVDHGNLQ